MNWRATASVVIPAHDEQMLVGRALDALLIDARPGEFEVIVVANGCSDSTADVARSRAGVAVVEIAAASKSAALNAGDQVATVLPRIYLDADVVLPTESARALRDLLAAPAGPLVAAPVLRMDSSKSSLAVRMQQRVWELSDFRRTGHVGSGVYALSADGRARFGDFPDVIADDRYVQQLFAHDERATVEGHEFTVEAPRTMRAQLHRSRRAAAGNAQLVRLGLHGNHTGTHGSRRALLRRVIRRPALWPAFAVYAVAHVLPRISARLDPRAAQSWARDETSRA